MREAFICKVTQQGDEAVGGIHGKQEKEEPSGGTSERRVENWMEGDLWGKSLLLRKSSSYGPQVKLIPSHTRGDPGKLGLGSYPSHTPHIKGSSLLLLTVNPEEMNLTWFKLSFKAMLIPTLMFQKLNQRN